MAAPCPPLSSRHTAATGSGPGDSAATCARPAVGKGGKRAGPRTEPGPTPAEQSGCSSLPTALDGRGAPGALHSGGSGAAAPSPATPSKARAQPRSPAGREDSQAERVRTGRGGGGCEGTGSRGGCSGRPPQLCRRFLPATTFVVVIASDVPVPGHDGGGGRLACPR